MLSPYNWNKWNAALYTIEMLSALLLKWYHLLIEIEVALSYYWIFYSEQEMPIIKYSLTKQGK